MRRTTSLVGLIWIPILWLTGCQPSPTSGNASQIVARVGDQDISLLQFNHALKALGIPRPNDVVRREITEKLIDRELVVAEALAAELDRSPDVLLQLEEARRDVLARAYAERIALTAPSPVDNDIARYYAEHPGLFAQRRIYRLRELTLSASAPEIDELKQRFAQGQDFNQISQWLRAKNAGFNEQINIRAAEQLPIEALPRLSAANEGQAVIFETPRGIIAYSVMSAQAAPISWSAARPIIHDYLSKQSGKRVMDEKVRKLRAATSIHYHEAFAPAKDGATDPGPADRKP